MATKTFKIGEYCQGGIITVETSKTQIAVIGKEWDMSKGTRRSSDQTKAKEFTRLTININDSEATRKLSMFLNELTTSYYTDEVIKWIESKCDFKKSMFW
jgi:hypothetical protein